MQRASCGGKQRTGGDEGEGGGGEGGVVGSDTHRRQALLGDLLVQHGEAVLLLEPLLHHRRAAQEHGRVEALRGFEERQAEGKCERAQSLFCYTLPSFSGRRTASAPWLRSTSSTCARGEAAAAAAAGAALEACMGKSVRFSQNQTTRLTTAQRTGCNLFISRSRPMVSTIIAFASKKGKVAGGAPPPKSLAGGRTPQDPPPVPCRPLGGKGCEGVRRGAASTGDGEGGDCAALLID